MTLKSNRGLNLEPRMTSNKHKLVEHMVLLNVQFGKVIKKLMLLKVRTRNFDKGFLFEIAQHSNPIEIST